MSIRWLTVFLDLPSASQDVAEAFWCEVTGTHPSPRRGPDGEFATLVPVQGDAYLRVQRVRDGSGGRHLDLHLDLDAETLDQAAARATALGAEVVGAPEDGLVVLRSPGGFRFCLVPWNGESVVPPPVRPVAGGANRADQLCLDIPSEGFEAECAFWAALTGWDRHPGSRPEFAYLERPVQLPVRLLLQRRDADPAGPAGRAAAEPVTAHLDVACADVEQLVLRQVRAGARVVARFPRWVTLVDPAGQVYCLTGRDPATGKLPEAGA